jgi:signal transduction histidine kinase
MAKLVSLEALVSLTVERMGPLATARHLQVESVGHPTVRGDADRLGQVLNNLLDNAIRHTRADGAITVKVQANKESHCSLYRIRGGPQCRPNQHPHTVDRVMDHSISDRGPVRVGQTGTKPADVFSQWQHPLRRQYGG